MAKKRKQKLEPFDKYAIYTQAVQSPDTDVRFFRKVYKQIRAGKTPHALREDFCAAYAISCSWVQLDKKNVAYGVDLDPETLDYGHENNLPMLTKEEQNRLCILEADVLTVKTPKVDIVAAMNFSYFFFKERKKLKAYFAKVFKDLKNDGVFILDCFGGSMTQEPNEENTRHRKFIYYWDQRSYDPISGEALFYIHFKRKGEGKRREKVFTYDWRLWSLPELRDILEEVGFSRVDIYWEGTTKSGAGDGVFKRVTKGEHCEAWIAYIAAVK